MQIACDTHSTVNVTILRTTAQNIKKIHDFVDKKGFNFFLGVPQTLYWGLALPLDPTGEQNLLHVP